MFIRDIKNINITEFNRAALESFWESVLKETEINEKLAMFEETYAPVRKIRIIKQFLPRITLTVKYMMRIRDRVVSEYRKSLKNVNVTSVEMVFL